MALKGLQCRDQDDSVLNPLIEPATVAAVVGLLQNFIISFKFPEVSTFINQSIYQIVNSLVSRSGV